MENEVGKTNKRKRAEKERKKNELRSGGADKAEVPYGYTGRHTFELKCTGDAGDKAIDGNEGAHRFFDICTLVA